MDADGGGASGGQTLRTPWDPCMHMDVDDPPKASLRLSKGNQRRPKRERQAVGTTPSAMDEAARRRAHVLHTCSRWGWRPLLWSKPLEPWTPLRGPSRASGRGIRGAFLSPEPVEGKVRVRVRPERDLSDPAFSSRCR